MKEADRDNFVERRIREAMEKGEFDNLPGEGKPLPHDEANPFAEPDKQLAYHLLKSNGFTLPWIARRKEIQAQLERLAIPLRRAEELHRARVAFRPDDRVSHDQWRRAQENYMSQIEALNQDITLYNLMVPSDAFRLPPLAPPRELARALAEVLT